MRFIFDMALQGHTIPKIVKMLNQAELPTPGTLTEKIYKGKQMMVRKNTSVVCWQYNMVWGILKNRVYTGACVNFKRSKTAPCGVHTKKNEEEKQIIVPDCHEAIVTEEEFQQAFEHCRIMKGKRNRKNDRKRPRRTVLSGFCVCGYCNRVMQYEYRATLPDIFLCPTTRHADVPVDENTCDCREYEVDKINAVVLKAVKQIGELAEIAEAEKQIDELNKEMVLQAEVDDEQLKEIENISLFAKEPALTKEMAEYMIKEVRVYRDDRYEIIWNFKNCILNG